MYALNIRKEFNEKKGSIGFGLENFVTPSMKIRSEIKSATINPVTNVVTTLNQNSTNIMYNMSFRVNFSYRIGKMSFESTKRKKSINNDDLKDGGGGGDNNQGGGMEQGQQRNGGGGGQQPQQMGGRPSTGNGQPKGPVKPTDEKKKGEKKTDEVKKEEKKNN